MVSREFVDNIPLKRHTSITKTKCYIVFTWQVYTCQKLQNPYIKVILTNDIGYGVLLKTVTLV